MEISVVYLPQCIEVQIICGQCQVGMRPNPYVCKDISGSVDSLTLYKHSLALYHETATSVSSKELENDLYLSCKAFRPFLTEINVFCKYFTSGIICKDSTMSRIDTETVSCLQN